MQKAIYLDHAATTAVDPEVVRAMRPYWTEKPGNASSVHRWGREAREAVEKARGEIARILNCQSEEVIFTSGATESNNLALKGVVEASSLKRPHLVVSPIEHHCVLDAAQHLEKQGVEVTWLPVDRHGLVDPRDVGKSIRKNTVLVSVMWGNNEVGTVEPIGEIASEIAAFRSRSESSFPYFHTDAVQAIQYLDIDVQKLGVDLLSLSAHKFYGPKGVGMLYIRQGTKLTRQRDGGGQEFGLRAGTENVAGIVGMAAALKKVAAERSRAALRISQLCDRLIAGVLEKVPDSYLTGHPDKRLPHIASFIIEGVEGEALLLMLDQAGVAASSGSACTSGLLEPSHVLTAMGIPPEAAHGSLRLSLGKSTTGADVDYVLEKLPGVVKRLRKMAPSVENY